ncbi:MAG TPA: hypothetical protein EYM39_01540 [Candidatus Latescibacteria bacterium]|nr:hypothetical protein [Candidatus Latescibacterota bacterium]
MQDRAGSLGGGHFEADRFAVLRGDQQHRVRAGPSHSIPVFEILLSREADLYQRMSRILIAELSAQLTAANEAMGAISDRRADLERRLQVARDERNDLRMPASMRGVVE